VPRSAPENSELSTARHVSTVRECILHRTIARKHTYESLHLAYNLGRLARLSDSPYLEASRPRKLSKSNLLYLSEYSALRVGLSQRKINRLSIIHYPDNQSSSASRIITLPRINKKASPLLSPHFTTTSLFA
jgi:hypothetical protein